MANCESYLCDPLGTHNIVDCRQFPKGGIRGIFLLECGAVLTDPTDPTEYNALIASGEGTLIRDIKGELPEASAVTAESPVACEADDVINYDRTFNLMDGNVRDDNIEFYNGLFNGRAFEGFVFFECDSNKVTFVNQTVKWTGSRIVPNTDNDRQTFSAVASWRDITMASRFDAPAGIFS